MTITATPQQEATYSAVKDTGDHIALAAVAGAGKTSTIVQAATLVGDSAGFMAFSKAIQEELRHRLPASVDARTLHSHGLRILTKKFRGQVDFSRGKDWELVEAEAPELFDPPPRPGGRRKASSDALIVLDLIDDVKNGQLFDLTPEELIQAEADTFTDCERDAVLLATYGLQLARSSIEDLTRITGADMVSAPVYHEMVRPMYRTLFVDEAQDLNPSQRMLALNSADRIIYVGDRRQAIMGFAGADARSFDRIGDDLRGDPSRPQRELPLSVCFRCPTSHAYLASLIEPAFTSPGWAKPGTVDDCIMPDLAKNAREGALVICRTNAPLVGGAFQMIRQGRKALVRGRAIGDGLLALTKKWKVESASILMQRMDKWLDRENEKLDKRPGDHTAAKQALEDRYDCIKFFCDQVPTVTQVQKAITDLFSDATPANSVVFSSIHRSKGLEAEQVFWMDAAKMGTAVGQEANLVYVALTRSKSELWMTGNAAPLASRDLPAFAAGIGGRG